MKYRTQNKRQHGTNRNGAILSVQDKNWQFLIIDIICLRLEQDHREKVDHFAKITSSCECLFELT